MVYSTRSLWEIVRNAVGDPQAGSITFILDALDECAEHEFQNLVENVENQFRDNKSRPSKLKYLMTCRPYHQILSKFHRLLSVFPNVHIPGENESEKISQEVNHVIKYRVKQLRMKDQFKNYLEETLQGITHRTYLWVYLVFEYLESEVFKKTLKGLKSTIETLPRTVNEAYERILNKAGDDQAVQRILHIILAATRPLTLAEMSIALSIDYNLKSLTDLDMEDDHDFRQSLRFQCGLFVSIYQGSIYLLHQTAREFLLADLMPPTDIPSELRWHRSITLREAHATFSQICVLFFNYHESDHKQMPLNIPNGSNGFFTYSATYWAAHFYEANFEKDAAIVPFALNVCKMGLWKRFGPRGVARCCNSVIS
ncbi:hypothetical protein NW762_006505 [Fusarium torreyae]|uniref:NACHT domain-containing protein n=1 Tax=Fusarium torreyae TaxID=1237075 RepID=A0A9W8S2J9_9HYPO|nr:hypothetical protein NW762_006505 [Fusarium torreyae]